jgi:NADH-quinone oxidoreductase subunit F
VREVIGATVASTFDEIKKRAESHWHELRDDQMPVILVGTATCGRAAGALEVLQAVKEVVKKQNLNCLIFEVGCLGHCYAEPLVIIRKPGYPSICYGHVTPVLAENLVVNLILKDDPCLEFVLGAFEENELIPSFSDFPRAKFEKRIILEKCGQINPDEIGDYIGRGGLLYLYLSGPGSESEWQWVDSGGGGG